MRVTTPLFNREWYLIHNPDVAAAVAQGLLDPLQHFLQYGVYEGRSPGPLLDVPYYLRQNPDVAAAVARGETTAYHHFLAFGMAEGRAPLALFDANYYLTHSLDVAQAVREGNFTPIQHFVEYGQYEGRIVTPIIDLGAYMDANPDVYRVVQAGEMSAMEHLMLYGIHEKRDLGNGITFGMMYGDPVFLHLLGEERIVEALLRVTEVAPYLPDYGPKPDPDPPGPGPDPDPDPGPGPWGTPDNPFPLRASVSEYRTPDTENYIKLANLSASQSQIIHAELGENNFFATSSAALTDHLTIDGGCGCGGSELYATLDQSLDSKYAPHLLNVPILHLTAEGSQNNIGLDLRNSTGVELIIDEGATANLTLTNVAPWTFDVDLIPIWLAAVDIDRSVGHELVVQYTEPTQESCGCGSQQELILVDAHLARFAVAALDSTGTEVSANIDTLLIEAYENSGIHSFKGNGPAGSGLDASLTFVWVEGSGSLELNLAELKGNGIDDDEPFVSDFLGYAADSLILKLADLDTVNGNKSDLSTAVGEQKSNHLVILPCPLEDAVIEIQNMTLTSTWGYTHDPEFNDSLDLTAWCISGDELASSVTSLTVKQGDLVKDGGASHYVDFIFSLDLNGADPGGVSTLILSNVVTDGEYNLMLQAIDTVNNNDDLDDTLDLINWAGSIAAGDLSNEFFYPPGFGTEVKIEAGIGQGLAAIQGIIGVFINEFNFEFH